MENEKTRLAAVTAGRGGGQNRLCSNFTGKSTLSQDIFRNCRERVSAQDAARHYGLTFDRKGWAVCPFHPDKHPSMSFKDGRFRCWACGASGDSIDFTGQLLGLSPLEAVERLNADFALSLPLHRKPTQQEREAAKKRLEIAEAHKRFEEWRKALCVKACEAYRLAHTALQKLETPADFDRLTEQETEAIRWQSWHEYLADALTHGEAAEQMELFRDRQVIEQRIYRILNSTPPRSKTA